MYPHDDIGIKIARLFRTGVDRVCDVVILLAIAGALVQIFTILFSL